jgi:hypothetical protein
MITLTLEENQILNNEQAIPDLPHFLKSLPKSQDMSLILKSHDAMYHHCPIRKAARYIKSAEFTPNHWVGEKNISSHLFPKRFPFGHMVIGGILPSLFMHKAIHLLSEYSFALKGVYVWADLITQAYSPLPMGWTIISHDEQLMVCQDQILRFSRPCYLPLEQELPSILRYLKRFGYESGMSITILAATPVRDLPAFAKTETRVPHVLKHKGITLDIPELKTLHRLYSWPQKIKKVAYGLTLLNAIGIGYYSWQVKTTLEQDLILKAQVAQVSIKSPLNKAKMEAFDQYLRLAKDRPNPLTILRRLIPLMKDDAVATYLRWTPNSLTLHLELNPLAAVDQLWVHLRAQFHDYRLTWQPEKNEPLKGVFTIEKKNLDKTNL